MMSHQTVIVLDFGGQYNQLIARRVRECGVYCEVKPYTTPLEKLRAMEPIGFIFTGGPNSVYEAGAPKADPAIFELGVPVLGICYGCQFMAHTLGGQVTEAHEDTAREYGKTETYYDTACKLFKGLPERGISWMSHGDYMAKVPEGFALTAHSDACPNVAIADEKRGFYGVQYHPEVNHTEHGVDMIRNFLYEVTFRRHQSTGRLLPGKRPAEHDPGPVQRHVRRRVLTGNDFRAVHPAVHQRFHHHSAPVHRDSRAGASAEGRRRGRQEEDRQHHPLQHGRHRPAAGLCVLYDDAQLQPHQRDFAHNVWAAIVIILTFTSGSALIMWLGEQITEFGIGNGISIILFVSIVARFPNSIIARSTMSPMATLPGGSWC